MKNLLEDWCNSPECAEVLGCAPELVSSPDGERDADGDTYNVWVEVRVSRECYEKAVSALDKDYDAFSKRFTDFAERNGCSAQILTSDREIVFELNFFK